MSFILDALKKSEADRQGNSSPGISDVPVAVRPSAGPRWLWVIVVLLGINLVVLMVMLLRPTGVEPAPERMAAESVTPVPDRQPPAITRAETPAPQRMPDVDRTAEPGNDSATDAVTPPPAEQQVREAAEPVARSTPAATPPPITESPESETLLTFNDLRASGSVNLPDLHIDLHVYSDTPAERFVFINMNQYRESATLTEGPRVARITTEGVVLEYVGTDIPAAPGVIETCAGTFRLESRDLLTPARRRIRNGAPVRHLPGHR